MYLDYDEKLMDVVRYQLNLAYDISFKIKSADSLLLPEVSNLLSRSERGLLSGGWYEVNVVTEPSKVRIVCISVNILYHTMSTCLCTYIFMILIYYYVI